MFKMTSQNVNWEDYFKKDYLITILNQTDGILNIVDKDNCIEAYDKNTDTNLRLHYDVDYENLFDFGSLKINKKKFFNIIKNDLEKILFLMPEKIYFVSSQEELSVLLKKYKTQSSGLNVHWKEHRVIIINLFASKQKAKWARDKLDIDFKYAYNINIWNELIRKLRELTCELYSIIPEEFLSLEKRTEDYIEDYINSCTWDIVYNKNNYCF